MTGTGDEEANPEGDRTIMAANEGAGAATSSLEFREHEGCYYGVGRGGRNWRISEALTGWRLEFRDPGDVVATYAGTHATVALAEREAKR
jgi:hypothetical protein